MIIAHDADRRTYVFVHVQDMDIRGGNDDEPRNRNALAAADNDL